jgi:hypothetical protein
VSAAIGDSSRVREVGKRSQGGEGKGNFFEGGGSLRQPRSCAPGIWGRLCGHRCRRGHATGGGNGLAAACSADENGSGRALWGLRPQPDARLPSNDQAAEMLGE